MIIKLHNNYNKYQKYKLKYLNLKYNKLNISQSVPFYNNFNQYGGTNNILEAHLIYPTDFSYLKNIYGNSFLITKFTAINDYLLSNLLKNFKNKINKLEIELYLNDDLLNIEKQIEIEIKPPLDKPNHLIKILFIINKLNIIIYKIEKLDFEFNLKLTSNDAISYELLSNQIISIIIIILNLLNKFNKILNQFNLLKENFKKNNAKKKVDLSTLKNINILINVTNLLILNVNLNIPIDLEYINTFIQNFKLENINLFFTLYLAIFFKNKIDHLILPSLVALIYDKIKPILFESSDKQTDLIEITNLNYRNLVLTDTFFEENYNNVDFFLIYLTGENKIDIINIEFNMNIINVEINKEKTHDEIVEQKKKEELFKKQRTGEDKLIVTIELKKYIILDDVILLLIKNKSSKINLKEYMDFFIIKLKNDVIKIDTIYQIINDNNKQGEISDLCKNLHIPLNIIELFKNKSEPIFNNDLNKNLLCNENIEFESKIKSIVFEDNESNKIDKQIYSLIHNKINFIDMFHIFFVSEIKKNININEIDFNSLNNYIIVATTLDLFFKNNKKIFYNNTNEFHAEENLLNFFKETDKPIDNIYIIKFSYNEEHLRNLLNNIITQEKFNSFLITQCGLPCNSCLELIKKNIINNIYYSNYYGTITKLDNSINKTYTTNGIIFNKYDDYFYNLYEEL